MAQPSGFTSNTSSAAVQSMAPGPGGPIGPSHVSNGQPPLWGKPPYTAMKPPKQSLVSQQYSNTANVISSNGTPRQNFSSPGSLSSQSSRDPSPIPSSCSDSMTQSRENLSNPNTNILSRHSPQQRLYQGPMLSSHNKISSDYQRPFSMQHTADSGYGSLSSQFRPPSNNEVSSNNQLIQGQNISVNSANSNVSGRTISPRVSQNKFPQDISSNVQMQKESQFPPESGDSLAQSRKFPLPSVPNVSSTFQMHSQPIVASHSSANGPPNFNTNSAIPVSQVSGASSQARTTDSLGVSSLHLKNQQFQGQETINVKAQVTSMDGSRSTMQTNPQFSTSGSSVGLKHQVQQPNMSMSLQQHNQSGPLPSNVPGQNMPLHIQTSRGNQVQHSQSQLLTSHVPGTSAKKPDQISDQGYSLQQRPNLGMPAHSVMSQLPKSSASTALPTQPPLKPTMQSPNMPPTHPYSQSLPPTSMPGNYAVQSSQQYSYPEFSATSPLSRQGTLTASSSAGMEQMSHPNLPPGSQGSVYSSTPNQMLQYPPASNVGYQHGMPVTSQYQSGPVSYDGHLSKRYPQQQGYPSAMSGDGMVSQMANLSVTQQGFNKLWGLEYYDLLQTRNILPPEKVEPPKVKLHQEFLDNVNCSPEIFRCTLTKVPESNSLLQKSRLPLGILIHPFKDLNHLSVIQCSTIVRCRVCRTYIHPFVFFVDHKRWKCNLCFRVNELPEEFQYDPISKTYGDPTRRPEVKSSTIEFIAPSEYMLRPPQPAVYLFLLDVSQLAVESGYLQIFCDVLLVELDRLPGDGRTQIGFITFDSTVHFYNLAEGLSQPQQMIVVETDDVFLPCPDNLLVNLAESRELVRDLLQQLPQKFHVSYDNHSTLGPALQAAYKLMAPTGGRITVFQSCLPTVGPGSLTSREDPSQRAGKEAPHLNPATDFYKCLSLDCSGQQVAVDVFLVNSQYCDLATISGVSRFSGGCIYHFPLFKSSNIIQAEHFEGVLRRYLARKIGFEAVMRIRCSRGLAIHTFHGNFFVRSTDLLSLPNINPDAGFGMQVSIEESLSELQNICFQAALLYTTSKGERRIRVHTLCLPVATTLPDILHSADQQCIVGLLAKMAVDRSLQSSLSDARDAFINVAIDVLSAYRIVQTCGPTGGLLAPHNLRLLPLYILALLKCVAFRTGQSTRLDDRLFAMCQMKTLPLASLIQTIYPDLYPVHCLEDQIVVTKDGISVPQPPRLHLSAEKLEQRGAFLLDSGDHMMIYVGHNVATDFCTDILGVSAFNHIPDQMYELPVLETVKSENIRNFINHLQSQRSYCATLEIIRDDSPRRGKFTERLLEDRTESALSYYEFLQHLKANVK